MTIKKTVAERPTARGTDAKVAEQKPDTGERAKKLTMGQTPKTED